MELVAREVRPDNEKSVYPFKRRLSSEESLLDEPVTKRGRDTEVSTLTPTSRDSSASSTISSKSASYRPKRYICAECDKAYNRPSLLRQHLMTHTGDKLFECDECGEAFSRKGHLARHKLKHLDNEDKPFHCSVCSKGCNSKQHLRRHERVHEKSFRCDQCDEAFYKHQTMKHHISTVHLRNRLTCEYCNKEFQRASRLQNHKLKQHNESPGFQCTFAGCFKNFKTWNVLRVHLKTDHPKLICSICGKGCIATSGLEMHMKIHDEERVVRIWNCKHCTKSYQKKDDLIIHCVDEHYELGIDVIDMDLLGATEFNTSVPSSEVILSQKLDLNVQKENATSTIFAKRVQTKPIPDEMPLESMTQLISENVEQRTIPCKYKNCHRLFKKQYDLDRHLKWHAQLDVKLNSKIRDLRMGISSQSSD